MLSAFNISESSNAFALYSTNVGPSLLSNKHPRRVSPQKPFSRFPVTARRRRLIAVKMNIAHVENSKFHFFF